MGLSEGEFWEKNITKIRPYLRARDIKKEEQNYMLWLQGLYFANAVSVSLYNAFAKKGSKAKQYMEEPLRITPLTDNEKKEKAEREREKVIAFFSNLKVKE